jgi:F0F1-type ATP synthase assembly protein I
LDEKPQDTRPTSPEAQRAKRAFTTAELALELPFTIVAAMVLGGVIGYFLDYRFHIQWVFTLILGGLGFVAGLREVIRRLT